MAAPADRKPMVTRTSPMAIVLIGMDQICLIAFERQRIHATSVEAAIQAPTASPCCMKTIGRQPPMRLVMPNPDGRKP